MKTKITFLAFLIYTSLFIQSCKKESDNEPSATQATNTYEGTSDFFKSNGVQFQNFTVNGMQGGSFTASKGTSFTIPPNAFVDQNQQPVSGNVIIKVKEIYENSDMLLSNVTTTCNGYPLLSGGMFYFEPTLNGETLQLAPFKTYTAELPADTLDFEMIPFFGNVDSANNVNWVPADTFGTGLTFTPVPQSYLFESDSVKWCNVDRFYQTPSDISITVNTLNNPNPDSTHAYVWFTGFDAVWDLQQNSSNLSQFLSSHVKPVPSSIIALTVHQGKIYAGILTMPSLTANYTYDIDMQLMTDAEFKAAIQALE